METRDVAGHESESPIQTWRLHREAAEGRDALSITTPALDAMFLLADGLLEPIALHAEVGWLDLDLGLFEGYAPHMEWRLGRRRPAPGRSWDRWPVPETLELVDAIDRAAAERFIARISDQQGPAGSIACPFLLAFSSVRARLLEPVPPDVDDLLLDRKEGPGSVTIERDERGAWVSGPGDGFVTAPVDLRALLGEDPFEIRVTARWSLWGEEDRPGTLAVGAAVARVAASGWELEE